MRSLTMKMLEVLKELDKPKARAHYMPYMGRFNQNAYYFLSITMRPCTSQVRGLRERNLVDVVDEDGFGRHRVVINKNGRKVLRTK